MKRRWFLQILSAIPLLGFGCPALLAAQRRPIPTTVDELYRAMNEAMPVGESTVIRWAVTGEEYVAYRLWAPLAGDFDEMAKQAALCRAMWFTFLKVWESMDNPKAAALYWRITPEIDYHVRNDSDYGIHIDEETRERGARIYLRYLVSSKPEIYTEEQLLQRRYDRKYG